MEIVTYTPTNDTKVNDSLYDFVIKYNTESPFELLNEIRICEYEASANLTCSEVKMWLNGTVASSDIVIDTDGRQCCNFDTFGVFSRIDIRATEDRLFFLLNNAIESDQMITFERIVEPIVPEEVAILYAFRLSNTTLEIDGDNTRITLTVDEVDHSTNPDFNHTGCNDRDATMSTITLSGCTLSLDSQNVTGQYSYLMPSLEYERCAESVTIDGEYILYNSTIDLPDNDGECYYFEPGNDIQPITVKIEQESETEITQETTALGITIANITTERCLPYESYVLAHAQIVYDLVYRFNGTNVDLIDIPYLNDVSNPVQIVSKICIPNECTFRLRTSQCERIYIADDDLGCVFERNDVYVLYNISVDEQGNPFSPTNYRHDVAPLDTNTETRYFPLADCSTPDYLKYLDVTDQYNYELDIENLPAPDWFTQEDIIDFFEEIILRLRITDGPEFTDQDLQMTSVKFSIFDGVNKNLLSRVTFRLQDKIALMKFSGNPYFSDAHFCRYFQVGQCKPFYSTHTNPFVTSTVVNRLDEVCQTNIDTTRMDFFSFLFDNWITRIDTSNIIIVVEVIARLQLCTSITNSGRRNLQTNTNTIEYIVGKKEFQYNNDNTTVAPTTSPTPVATTEETDNTTRNVLIGVLVPLFAILFGCCFWFFIMKKREKKETSKTYAQYGMGARHD